MKRTIPLLLLLLYQVNPVHQPIITIACKIIGGPLLLYIGPKATAAGVSAKLWNCLCLLYVCLQQGGVGMTGKLVDNEDYPRADIDVNSVRTARHRIICKLCYDITVDPSRARQILF